MRLLSILIFLLAFVVVVLGATTRLKNAGLGCPDWPGCYGHLFVPQSSDAIGKGPLSYQQDPNHKALEPEKAWAEMIHRYVAGSLGLLIIVNLILSITNKKNRRLSLIIFAVVLFQALLGMWTVTLKLHPLIVMSHLTGGITVLTLATVLVYRRMEWQVQGNISRGLFVLTLVASIALDIQVVLGGWTSANYAALACPDFPTCQGRFVPEMDFKEGFLLPMHFGANYEYGVMGVPARTAVHMTHRMGALVVFLLLSLTAILNIRQGFIFKKLGWVILVLLIVQILLGISNVVFNLRLPIAVLHNANAALLVQAVMTLLLFQATLKNRHL
ncbi:COX15/CtaA family protein [bacterium]|nr:COX15/CtaA family protein [bacterium]